MENITGFARILSGSMGLYVILGKKSFPIERLEKLRGKMVYVSVHPIDKLEEVKQ